MNTAVQPDSTKPTAPIQVAPPTAGNIDPATLSFFKDDFSFLDTETTGMDPNVDRIVEIAIVRFRNGVREVFHTLVDPEMPIPATASAVHHITDETIAEAKARGEAPTFAEIADKVVEMLDGGFVIAHNRGFDEPMVDGHLGIDIDPKSWLCTVRLARHLLPQAPAFGNQVLRYWLKTQPESEGLGAHRAIDDVYVSLENLYHIAKAGELVGVKSLEGLHELSNRLIVTRTMPFGKHAGKDFKDIPSDYFEYMLGNMTDLEEDLRHSMTVELARPGRKDDDARIRAEELAKVVPATHMHFGKPHNGKAMADVPMDYLEWMEREKPRCTAEVRAGVAKELERRRALAADGSPAASAHPRGNTPAQGAAPAARFATPAQAVFARLSTLVNKGSDEERVLLSTAKAQDPEAALIEYLNDFRKNSPGDFARVSSLTAHAEWMHEVTGGASAARAPAARAAAPAVQLEQPAADPNRKSLFARRQDDPVFDDIDVPGGVPEGDAPFEEASAPRRMRMR